MQAVEVLHLPGHYEPIKYRKDPRECDCGKKLSKYNFGRHCFSCERQYLK